MRLLQETKYNGNWPGERECPPWVVDFVLEDQVYTFRFLVLMICCWCFWIPYFLIRTYYLINVRMRNIHEARLGGADKKDYAVDDTG